ncbi:aquaporin-11-like [Notechis scutatus]|uniref:Aquaporin-11-like n=1 Tax=Notechis scutatus TaxID=8663 RepID=A0A6J1VZD6_9SAUR|nr:aquaporin-11-like [Notechis scutatus]
MDTNDALISLLVMAAIILLVGACRQLAYRGLRRTTNWFNFAQELTATFQICACTHELCLLGSWLPHPQVALWLTYIFTVLHGWTLAGSVGNPASSIQHFYKGQLRVRAWCLQTSAQFAAAILAHLCMKLIWMLGFSSGHSKALPDLCSNPIQTTISNAFGLEFLFSFLLHLTLLQFQAMSPTIKVHLVALLITSFVYAGWWVIFPSLPSDLKLGPGLLFGIQVADIGPPWSATFLGLSRAMKPLLLRESWWSSG